MWRDSVDMRMSGAPSKSLATPMSVVRGAPPAASRVANAPVRASRISRLASATAWAWASFGSAGALAMAALTLRADRSNTTPAALSGQEGDLAPGPRSLRSLANASNMMVILHNSRGRPI